MNNSESRLAAALEEVARLTERCAEWKREVDAVRGNWVQEITQLQIARDTSATAMKSAILSVVREKAREFAVLGIARKATAEIITAIEAVEIQDSGK